MEKVCSLSARHFTEIVELIAPDALHKFTTPQEAASAWHACMLMPLDAKGVKYAKAVSRILEEPATRYHAVEYRDYEALLFDCEYLRDIGLDEALKTHSDKNVAWKVMQLASRHAQTACSYEPSRTPSPKEISKNISEHRIQRRHSKNAPAVSMTQAFEKGLYTLADALELAALRARISKLSPDALKSVCQEWAAFVSTDIEAHIHGRRGEELSQTSWPFLQDTELLALKTQLQAGGSDELWAALESLTSFSKVHAHIPQNMMSKIEACAQQLAGSISSGQQSLEDLDLTKIGESVLAECSEQEMSQVANNLQSLLPTLGSLQKAVAQPPAAPVPPIAKKKK